MTTFSAITLLVVAGIPFHSIPFYSIQWCEHQHHGWHVNNILLQPSTAGLTAPAAYNSTINP